MTIQGTGISYADLEKLGWPNSLVNDYLEMRSELTPVRGTTANPNTVYASNSNGMYVNTSTNELWFNPTPGQLTGWVQLI